MSPRARRAAAKRARRTTTFTVAMPRPETHLYEITMQVAPFASPVGRFDLVLPVWTPGSYLVREFSRHVRDVSVEGPAGAPLRVVKAEKNRWRVGLLGDPSVGPFTVRYRVYAHELTVRTSHLDASHGYGNGANLFFYVEGRKDEPQRLRFELPPGWRVSTSLPRGRGGYRASDYDELVDSPFECGTHRSLAFRVLGVPHELAIWGEGNENPGLTASSWATSRSCVARWSARPGRCARWARGSRRGTAARPSGSAAACRCTAFGTRCRWRARR